MMLKPIVASLGLLAAASTFAAYHTDTGMQTAASNAKVAKLQAELDRNQNDYYAEADWFKRITISGLVQSYVVAENGDHSQVDFFGQRRIVAFPGNSSNWSSDLWLSRADVYVDADVNQWVTTHVALDLTSLQAPSGPYATVFDEDSAIKFRGLNEANVIIGNFDLSAYYMRVGRMYARYGWYERNVLPQTLPQMLTETQVNGVEIGVASLYGFNASAMAFKGSRLFDGSTNINNFVLQLGYGMERDEWGFEFSTDFMYNLASLDCEVATPHPECATCEPGTYRKAVPGISLEAKAHWERFEIMGTYTTALTRFDQRDLRHFQNGLFRGATPSAFLVGVAYNLPTVNCDRHSFDSRIDINYQMSFETDYFLRGLPAARVQADYNINVWKNTDLQLTVHCDQDQDVNHGGTSSTLVVGLVGLSAKFA